jgi:hypothetical protein
VCRLEFCEQTFCVLKEIFESARGEWVDWSMGEESSIDVKGEKFIGHALRYLDNGWG